MSDSESNSDPEEGNSDCSKGDSENSNLNISEPSTSKRRRQCSRVSRTRSCTSTNTSTEHKPLEWTEEEKMQLAIALQRHGHKDIINLQKEIPTKSFEQIKAYTYWAIKKSRLWFCNGMQPGSSAVIRKGKNMFSKAPIDQWLNAFEEVQASHKDEFRESLSKTFLYISRYEPHPDPKDCDGVDYAAMYEFLYLALNGYPVKAVTPETAAAILSALENLSQTLIKYGNEEEVEFLSKVKRIVYVENATQRHYGKKKTVSEEKGPIESLLDVKGFNPLNIPLELLKNRQQSNS